MMKSILLVTALLITSSAQAKDVFDPNTYEFDAQSQQGPSVAVLYGKVQVQTGKLKSDYAHTVVFRIAYEKFTTNEAVSATITNHCTKAGSTQVQDTVLGTLNMQWSDMEQLFFATLPGRVGVNLDSTNAKNVTSCSQSVTVTIDGTALIDSSTGKTDFDIQM